MKTLQDIYDSIPIVPLMTYDNEPAEIMDVKNNVVFINIIGLDNSKNKRLVSREYKTSTGENYFEFRFRHLKEYIDKEIPAKWKDKVGFIIISSDDLKLFFKEKYSQKTMQIIGYDASVSFSDICLID